MKDGTLGHSNLARRIDPPEHLRPRRHVNEFRVTGEAEIEYLTETLPAAEQNLGAIGTYGQIPVIEDPSIPPGILRVLDERGEVLRDIVLFQYVVDLEALERAAQEIFEKPFTTEAIYETYLSGYLGGPLHGPPLVGSRGPDGRAFRLVDVA